VKTQQRKPILRRILRWLLPLGMSGIVVWLVLREIEFSRLIDSFSQIGWQTVLLASIVFFMSYFFRVFCWYTLLNRKVTFKDAFFVMGTGYLLNNIFPFRLGEIGRALLLDDPEGQSGWEVLSSVVVERVFDIFLAAVFFLSMLPRILDAEYDQTLIVIVLVVAAAGMVFLYLLARFEQKITAWFTRWGDRSDFVKTWLTPKVSQLLKGLSVLKHPDLFLLAFSSLAVSWFIAFGENFIIFQRLYPEPSFWWMIFVLSASAFGAALPSAPASLGIFEGVMVAAFALLSVDAELAFAHALIIHALAFVYTNIIGLIGLRLRGQTLVTLYRRAIHRKPDMQPSE